MITIIVPTRGRPHNIAALFDAWQATTVRHDTQLVVVVDHDPTNTAAYLAIPKPPNCMVAASPERRHLGGTLNHHAPHIAARGSHVGFWGDDHRPRTHGWDQMFKATLDTVPNAVVYGDDLIQHDRLPTAVVLHSNIINTLGYMVPLGLQHLYVDDYWKTLGDRLSTTRYLPDVIIEHCHPIAGTAPDDDGYRHVNSRERYRDDRRRFDQYCNAGELDQALTHLRNA